MSYKFIFREKEFELDETKLIEIINDEENPIENMDLNAIVDILKAGKNIIFERAYYDEPCECCEFGVNDKKYFPFIECQFYINTKDNKLITSSISDDNNGLSFNKLKKAGKVDTSYITFIEVCENCGSFFVVVEKVEE